MKLFEKFKHIYLKIIDYCMQRPKRIVRLVVLAGCCIIVFFQLWECVSKLLKPPVSTHSNFELNETMHYPAITFCRNPPFKKDIMANYNLSYHPTLTSGWKNFPFHKKTLADVYEQATYSSEEFFRSFSLEKNSSNIKIVMSLHFTYGRCYTVIPLVTTKMPWKDSGYSIRLLNGQTQKEFDTAMSGDEGWNMFLHMPIEEFTEYGISSSGRIENLYVEFNEEIELKMSVAHYTYFRGRGTKCSDDHLKSTSVCIENCIWRHIEEKVNCSGPWMKHAEFPYCDNYESIKNLINEYETMINSYGNEDSCECLKPCDTSIYSSFVMNRKSLEGLGSSQIYVYYTSKMVTKLSEKSGYDSTQFLADMGGSLGFLLGLSVIGFIIILEKFLGYMFLDKMVEKYLKKKNEAEQMSKKESEGVKEGKFLDM
ncbi:hypothetical protein ACKWTF_001443 [Chironomus riparius]